MINVAVLGYGTVGSGVVEVIEKNKDMVNKKSAQELEVKYILDLRDFPGDPYENKVIHDFNTILQDDSVTIICETMGGVGAAYQFTKQALELGKSVCTSNKELVAKHGPELLQIAREHNCNYLFEASVGGGIPIIRPLNYSLTAEKIEAVNGILNGTTNYILSKMEKEGADFDTVLKEAQDKGYAERNPEADVEGYDACRKIAILSSLMFGKNVDSEKVPTEVLRRSPQRILNMPMLQSIPSSCWAEAVRLTMTQRKLWWHRSCFPRTIPWPWYTECSMRYLSPAICWEIPCTTDGAQASFPPPVQWYRMSSTVQDIRAR